MRQHRVALHFIRLIFFATHILTQFLLRFPFCRRGVGYTLMTMAIGVPLIVYFHSTASSAQFQKAHKHSGGLGKRNLDGKKSE